jgi:hypothetical protein
MTAPVESVTVPSMEPSPAVWAPAGMAAHIRQIASASTTEAAIVQFPVRFCGMLIGLRDFVISIAWIASF